jgi:hypothetical protein
VNTHVPSPEPAAHLDLDALADVLADQATPEHTAHLRGCASCTSRLAELEAAEARVVTVLATLPPPAVPDDLADRLTAALAAETPLRPARASVTALPAVAQRHRTWLPAAAAAVLLVSGAGLGWSLLSSTGGSDTSDTAGSTGPEVVVAASGTDYADPAAVAAALPRVLTSDEVRTYAGGNGGSAARSNEDSALAEAQPDAEAQGPAATMLIADPLERLRTPDGLASCLAGLQATPDEAPIEPLAVDFATYEGAPALAVVLLDPDPDKLSVFVVGPQCAQADAQLLHFVRVDRP